MTIDLTHHVYNIELTKNMFWLIFSFKIVQCSPYLQVPTSTTMVLTKSGSSSHPDTWIALPQSILQIMFMVWLPNSFLRGQFTWLFEFPMLPLYRILIDQQRNQSEADLGCRRCYFVKSKLLHCPHHQLIIHLIKWVGTLGWRWQWWGQDRDRGYRRTTAVDNIDNAHHQAKSFENTCAGPSGHGRLRLPPTFEAAGGGPTAVDLCHHIGSDEWQRYHSNIREQGGLFTQQQVWCKPGWHTM